MKKHYLLLWGLILLCLSASSGSAQKMFLKADNLTNGGSNDRDFDDYVEITSLQHGLEAETVFGPGGGPGVGRPIPKSLIITKNADLLSTKIMEKIVLGEHFTSIEIVSTVADRITGRSLVRYKVELKNAFVTDVSTSSVHGCASDCPGVAESVKLVFKAIRITTYSVDSKGVPKANPPFMFDVEKGTLSF
ncbi:hypothetical protein GCM10010967_43380 [Dyadobacter beijingensis]|uniref:Type VI secretion system tube protein Hcp n=1 Tax=Dyadobacter beijingensis TaxID=365489 RepID=A0ABQ2IA39_9BACT|nr:type VI secretion system tube protein Hcp [Dyadobacter beijingensis]GGN03866.1 hypothetical protein GCM10010967_43380 [Dyadobacter beijingensis]